AALAIEDGHLEFGLGAMAEAQVAALGEAVGLVREGQRPGADHYYIAPPGDGAADQGGDPVAGHPLDAARDIAADVEERVFGAKADVDAVAGNQRRVGDERLRWAQGQPAAGRQFVVAGWRAHVPGGARVTVHPDLESAGMPAPDLRLRKVQAP